MNRGTLTRLYYETTERVEFEALDQLCQYFKCGIGDLLEYVPVAPTARAAASSKGAPAAPRADAKAAAAAKRKQLRP